MIVFGTCVGPSGLYEKVSLPSIEQVAERDSQVITLRDATSIFVAYNEITRQVRELPDVEALVLMHDDVVIQDINFTARIRRLLADPSVGVLGVVGHRNLHDLRYWRGRPAYGRVWDGNGISRHGPLNGEVDAVDGLLMVLSPSAFRTVDFDEATFSGFLGYDADYCLSCRKAGLRVLVEPFHVFHHSTGAAHSPQFAAANELFVNKWKDDLSRTPLRDRSNLVDQATKRLAAAQRQVEPIRAEATLVIDRLRIRARALARRSHDAPDAGASAQTADGGDEEKPRSCEACGGDLQDQAPGQMLRCAGCGSFRTWPSPQVDDESSQIFDESYGGKRLYRRAQWLKEARDRISWLETIQPEGILVEIGSATGEFMKLATERGYEAYGIEPSRWVKQEADYPELFSGTFDEWLAEYRDYLVDVVSMFHVLEHLEHPAEAIGRIANALRPGGSLVIEVPNAAARDAALGDPKWSMWTLAFHYWHFTPVGLRALLGRSGLVVSECREMTLRQALNNTQWEYQRSKERAAGILDPSLDILRVVAQRPR